MGEDSGLTIDSVDGPETLGGAVAFLLVGLAFLFLGSRWLIDSGRSILYQFGFTQRLVGLTILEFGTSLPEFAASVVAASMSPPPAPTPTSARSASVMGRASWGLLLLCGVNVS